MKTNGRQAPIVWTPEDRARQKAARDRIQRERPTPEELAASGQYEPPIPHGAYIDFCNAMQQLKTDREHRGISLTDVAEESGIDPAALSRLENGKQANPTLDTIFRYLDALDKQLVWVFEDCATQPSPKPKAKKATRQRSKV